MELVVNLLLVCILIEMWHILYYYYVIPSGFSNTVNAVKWCDMYRKMFDSTAKFGEEFSKNEQLNNAFGKEHLTLMSAIVEFLHVYGYQEGSHRILKTRPFKELMLYLVIQAIEIIYLGILIVLAFLLPPKIGICILIVTFLLSYGDKKYGDKHKMIRFVDSLICITLYFITAFIMKG